jgi:excisionase family DNA binding protein
MSNQIYSPKVYSPSDVAKMLQLSKNTVYELINSGQIIAKKIGKLYRIPDTSMFFFFTGLDYDLFQADQKDRLNLSTIEENLSQVRATL